MLENNLYNGLMKPANGKSF